LHPRFKTPGPGTYVPPSDFGYVTLSPRVQLLHDYAYDSSQMNITPRILNSVLLKKQVVASPSDAGRSTQVASTQ
jgi:hypothetical protein